MNKNENINIKALQNGYLVERSWREAKKAQPNEFDYRYMDEQFMFKTWDEVVEFVTQNKLDVPPAKIWKI